MARNEKDYPEEDYEKSEEEEDIYKEEDVEEELAEDEIKPAEAGFMEGYDKAAEEDQEDIPDGQKKPKGKRKGSED